MNELSFMDQLIIRKLTDIVLANLEKENFGVNELAEAAGMSRSSLNRRIKSVLRKSTSQFIREQRLHKAMEMLQSDLATASEISFKVGFNSPTYFNFCFHQYYGFPPGEVKKRDWTDLGLSDGGTDVLAETENQSKLSDPVIPDSTSLLKSRNLLVASTVILTLICLTFFWYFLFVSKATMFDVPRLKKGDKSIVVLPFKNLSDNSENQYFADGVMEDILNQLFNIKELQVISRTTGDLFRTGRNSAPEISRKLGVNFILEGSLQQHDNMIRIIVQLIDARHDRHIWSEKYDRDMADIFLIQSSIAKQVADKLETILSSDEIEKIDKIPTKIPEAYNFYLRGRFYWITDSREGFEKCIQFFEMALAADPNYALAYLGLADAYYSLAWWGWVDPVTGYCHAKEYAMKALELDNTLSEAHATLGAILCWAEWNWKEAGKEFNLAIQFNPNNAKVRQYYSEYLDMFGNNIEAREQINMAIKLDQISSASYLLSGQYFYHEGKFDQALDTYKKATQLNSDPLLTNLKLFDIYYWKNDCIKAIESLRTVLSLRFPGFEVSKQLNDTYNLEGFTGLLKYLILMEIKRTSPDILLLAKWNARIGKKKEALKWLKIAFDNHLSQLPKINNDPDFENLRREAGFKELISNLKLAEISNSKRTTHRVTK